MHQVEMRVPAWETLGFRGSTENKRLLHLSWDPGQQSSYGCVSYDRVSQKGGWAADGALRGARVLSKSTNSRNSTVRREQGCWGERERTKQRRREEERKSEKRDGVRVSFSLFIKHTWNKRWTFLFLICGRCRCFSAQDFPGSPVTFPS